MYQVGMYGIYNIFTLGNMKEKYNIEHRIYRAERVGFEPTVPENRHNGFRGRRLQPLGHLSSAKTLTFYTTLYYNGWKKIKSLNSKQYIAFLRNILYNCILILSK